MWKCKDCGVSKAKRSELLKYFKLDHRNFGRCHPYPCVYSDCPCSFKTWSSLKSHVSRRHPQHPPQKDALTTYACFVNTNTHHRLKTTSITLGSTFCCLMLCVYVFLQLVLNVKFFFFRSLFSVSLSYRLMPNFCASQPLQSKFMASLDRPSSQLLQVIRGKVGVLREKTKDTIKVMDQVLVACKQNCLWQSI